MKLKLALAQLNAITGDIKGNSEKVIKYCREAEEKGAELIVFPELFIPGYCSADRFENREFIKQNKKAVKEIAGKINIACLLGFVDYDKNFNRFNACAFISNRRLRAVYRKKLLPNYRFFDEKRYFKSDKSVAKPIKAEINKKRIKLGISICEDIWDSSYERKPVKELASNGAEIIIAINASPFYSGKIRERIKIIKRHIREVNLPFIYLNAVGASDNVKNIIVFDGFSMVFDRHGNLAEHSEQFKEELKIFDFDIEKNYRNERKRIAIKKEDELFSAISFALRDYCRKTGFEKALLGVSGGIDSAVACVIAAHALGRESVLAVNMPSKFSKEALKNAAKKLASNLGVELRVIEIDSILEEMIRSYEKSFGKIKRRVTLENMQARIRGNLLMSISNDENRLLISTGNKTEIALGYCTLYGDMSGGIELIGDVNKLEVYELARYINENHEKLGFSTMPIPEETIKAKPDAELWENAPDPFDYSIVAPLVDDIVVNHRTKSELLELFRKKKLSYAKNLGEEKFVSIVHEVFERLRKSVYKRGQAPPIIIVSKRAFGFDLRETIIDRWKG